MLLSLFAARSLRHRELFTQTAVSSSSSPRGFDGNGFVVIGKSYCLCQA